MIDIEGGIPYSNPIPVITIAVIKNPKVIDNNISAPIDPNKNLKKFTIL